MMDRRGFLRRSAIVAAGVVAADQLDLLDRLGWRRRFFPSAAINQPVVGVDPGSPAGDYGVIIVEASHDLQTWQEIARVRLDPPADPAGTSDYEMHILPNAPRYARLRVDRPIPDGVLFEVRLPQDGYGWKRSLGIGSRRQRVLTPPPFSPIVLGP